MKKSILISMYSHAELYPPTLNAIGELSKIFDQVVLIQRSHLINEWKYPLNVKVISHGKLMTTKQQENSSIFLKLALFLSFTWLIFTTSLKIRPAIILVYDPLAFMSFQLAKPFLNGKKLVWYHNHDIWETFQLRKYSISWFSLYFERKYFKKLDVFTLPAKNRLEYFPIKNFTGKCFVIPNYPSILFYSKFYGPPKIEKEIKLIFQGSVSEMHGLEQIIELLALEIAGKHLNLIVKGPCSPQYKQKLEEIALKFNVVDKLFFYGVTSYNEVPKIASMCHIGIGIHAKNDVMNITLGTASNKLYEYAAVGLPILYFNSPHFNQYLKQYKWAFSVELNSESIRQAIETIVRDYEGLSTQAHFDFTNSLNYETHFIPVADYLFEFLKLNRKFDQPF